MISATPLANRWATRSRVALPEWRNPSLFDVAPSGQGEIWATVYEEISAELRTPRQGAGQ